MQFVRYAAVLAVLGLLLCLCACRNDGGENFVENRVREQTGDTAEDSFRDILEDAAKDHPYVQEGVVDEQDVQSAIDDVMNRYYSDVQYTFSDGVLTASGSGWINYEDWIATVSESVFEPDLEVCRDEVEKVVIEDGVTGIGEQAFMRCRRLNEIVIPDSVTTIEDGAFRECSGWIIPANYGDMWKSGQLLDNAEAVRFLKEVNPAGTLTLDDILTPVGLSSITIPSSVTRLGQMVFWACGNLRNAEMRNAEVPDSVFEYCTNLTSVHISGAVSIIEKSAFSGCTALEEIEIPDGVTRIRDGAFAHCSSLTELVIPNSVVDVGSNVFVDSGLTKITIPAAVVWGNSATAWASEDIYDYSVLNCEKLTDITFLGDMTLEDADAVLSHFLYRTAGYDDMELAQTVTIHAPSGSVIEGYCKRQIERGNAPNLIFIPL